AETLRTTLFVRRKRMCVARDTRGVTQPTHQPDDATIRAVRSQALKAPRAIHITTRTTTKNKNSVICGTPAARLRFRHLHCHRPDLPEVNLARSQSGQALHEMKV